MDSDRDLGVPELCAGTVALCSLYYVHLMKERRRREFERKRRILRYRRMMTRERLRFAVLWTSRIFNCRDITGSLSSPEMPEPRTWRDILPSTPWGEVMENVFTKFDWIESFRMTRSTFDYLCEQLRPVMEALDTDLGQDIPAEVRLAMTLWRLGSLCEYRTIGKIFRVSRSTICKVVQDVCEVLVSTLTPKFISVPRGDILFHTIKAFEQYHSIPQLAGIIGTFHVPIYPPSEFSGQYFNAKGWHSVVVQAVVDCNHLFWDLNIGSPGNSSNSQVLLSSELYEWGTEGTLFPKTKYCVEGMELPIHLLGPRSYPLLPWLMTPSSEEERPESVELNRQFSSALNVAQVAFGHLKGRWCCLLKRSDSDLVFLPTLIATCCTLHNICESRGDPFQEHWLEEAAEEELEQPSECEEDDLEAEGKSLKIRDALASTVWVNNGGL
ncbi:uncharacterized protein [Engystomops pustulosus]|uniref:uncharacterized protein n=1 Tax=Engystomops pustulosus TaxID=76066 RepID=UPI003AFA3031